MSSEDKTAGRIERSLEFVRINVMSFIIGFLFGEIVVMIALLDGVWISTFWR